MRKRNKTGRPTVTCRVALCCVAFVAITAVLCTYVTGRIVNSGTRYFWTEETGLRGEATLQLRSGRLIRADTYGLGPD